MGAKKTDDVRDVGGLPPEQSIIISGIVWIIVFVIAMAISGNLAVGDDVRRLYSETLALIINHNLPSLPIGICIVVAVIAATAAAAAIYISLTAGVPVEVHVRGPRIGTARDIAAIEADGIRATGRGVAIGDAVLSRRRETGHMLILGLPGSGKTVTINSIILQIIERIREARAEKRRAEKIITHDPKGDYAAWIPSNLSIIVGPWDARHTAWRIGADVNTSALAHEIAAAWIPESKDPIFSNGARSSLAGVIMYLQKTKGADWDFSDLSGILQLDPISLCRVAIEGYPANSSILTMDDKGIPVVTTLNILTNMTSPLQWIHQIANADRIAKSKISLHDWILGNPKRPILVLKNDARYSAAGAGLFGAILKTIASVICGSEMNEIPPSKPGTWIIIDEYPQLGRETGRPVRQLQEFGRSRGARVIVAAQDPSQIIDIYGRDAGRAQMSVQQTIIYGRLSAQSAYEISVNSGRRLIKRNDTHVGARGIEHRASYAESPVIDPSDIMGLSITRRGPEILLVVEGRPAKIIVPFAKVNNVNPQHVENTAFSAAPSVPADESPFGEDFREGVDIGNNGDLSLSSSVINGIINRS